MYDILWRRKESGGIGFLNGTRAAFESSRWTLLLNALSGVVVEDVRAAENRNINLRSASRDQSDPQHAKLDADTFFR